jgi:hypothetical protein
MTTTGKKRKACFGTVMRKLIGEPDCPNEGIYPIPFPPDYPAKRKLPFKNARFCEECSRRFEAGELTIPIVTTPPIRQNPS